MIENAFKTVLHAMEQLFVKKNSDYGNSFEKTFNEFGLIAPLIRINDKVNRLNQIVTSGKQSIATEKVEDTLLDLANYCALTLALLQNDLPSNEKSSTL